MLEVSYFDIGSHELKSGKIISIYCKEYCSVIAIVKFPSIEGIKLLDLPTHFLFGLAVGFVFFGRPEIAFLICLGALLPDLDREYWFIPAMMYRDEQIHRAGLHNVFIMAITYLVSPFLALGVFLHVLQDSFTTVKDRGVEWFYPITRLVKHGMYDQAGNQQPIHPKEQVYFYQQDPQGLVEKADPDLREPGTDPVPWRRVYGFAQNSHLLDRGFLFGSGAVAIVWLLTPLDLNHLILVQSYLFNNPVPLVLQFGWVASVFIAGELDRRDRTEGPRLGQYNVLKYPILALGIVGLAGWLLTTSSSIDDNIVAVFSNPVGILLCIVAVPAVGIAILRYQTRKGKNTLV